jgi:molecular chaperone Hsp33
MSDYLVKIITRSGNVLALACVTTDLVSEAIRRHGTWPTASVALGRALTGGALMGALLKTGQRVALKFEGNGPLGKIMVEAASNGGVCGTVANPEVMVADSAGRLDVAGALGKAGFLTVTKDLGLKEPYRGVVQLHSSEIGADLAHYFTESEQTPSAFGLGVFIAPDTTIGVAGGFLIQAMPPVAADLVEQLMTRIEQLPPLSELLRNGTNPEQLLELLFAGIPFDTLEKRALAFHCSCSRERTERALLSLGKTELAALLTEKGEAEVTCEFCRESYYFSGEELQRLLESD